MVAAALIFAGLLGPSLPAPADCLPAGVQSVQEVSGRAQFIDRSGRCVLYVTADTTASSATLLLVFTDTLTTEPVAVPGGIVFSSDVEAPEKIRRMVVELLPGESKTFTIIARTKGTAITFVGQISYLPGIRVQSPAPNCPAYTLCLERNTTTQIPIVGSHLRNIEGDRATIAGPSYSRQFSFEQNQNHLTLIIPSDHGLSARNRYSLMFHLKSPAIYGGAITDSVVISDLAVTLPDKPRSTLSFTGSGPAAPIFFVGERRDFNYRLTDSVTQAGSYQLFETGSQEPIAYLNLRQDGSGSINVARPTSALNGGVPIELEARTGPTTAPVFFATLGAMQKPVVTGTTEVAFPTTGYRSASLRPGVNSIVTIRGTNVSQFTADISPEFRDEFEPVQGVRLPNELRLRVKPKANFRGPTIPLALRIPASSLDTVVMLPVQPNQRPRNLDFAFLHFRGKNFWPLTECLRNKRDSVSFSKAGGETSVCKLSDLTLTFRPDSIDQGGDLYGPQYLDIQAAILDPQGTELKRDTVYWVVSPPGYTLVPGYRTGLSLPVNELVENFGRYARPGSAVVLTIRHDQKRYEDSTATVVRMYSVRDQRRWSIGGYAGISTGLAYAARVNSTTRSQVPLLNGSAQDSVIHVNQKKGWDQGLVSAALSAAIDIKSYFSDGSVTPFRLRIGMFLMDSPYTAATDNRPALAVLYPLELYNLRGSVEFSLHGGIVTMAGAKPFPVLGLGVGFSTASGGTR